jgi:hypothetical protein
MRSLGQTPVGRRCALLISSQAEAKAVAGMAWSRAINDKIFENSCISDLGDLRRKYQLSFVAETVIRSRVGCETVRVSSTRRLDWTMSRMNVHKHTGLTAQGWLFFGTAYDQEVCALRRRVRTMS